MQRARARQAAITRNLYTWSNYKNWADQVRDSWQATDKRRRKRRQTQEIAVSAGSAIRARSAVSSRHPLSDALRR